MNTATLEAPEFYEVGDVARRLGVSVSAVHRWHREGLVAPRRTPNGTRIFTLGDIEELEQLRARRAANARHGGDVAA